MGVASLRVLTVDRDVAPEKTTAVALIATYSKIRSRDLRGQSVYPISALESAPTLLLKHRIGGVSVGNKIRKVGSISAKTHSFPYAVMITHSSSIISRSGAVSACLAGGSWSLWCPALAPDRMPREKKIVMGRRRLGKDGMPPPDHLPKDSGGTV